MKEAEVNKRDLVPNKIPELVKCWFILVLPSSAQQNALSIKIELIPDEF